MRTIILKLHKPSTLKKRILDEAILKYNRAYQFLLNEAYENIDDIINKYRDSKGLYKANTLSKWIGRQLAEDLNSFEVQPFKDSLKLDFGMTLAGYFKLKEVKPVVNFPKINETPFVENELSEQIDTEELRPVYFCRYDTKRSYCLLYDRLKDRYYAKLYLMNQANAKSGNIRDNDTGRLRYLYKDNSIFESVKAKETYIIVPLTFGKYQETYLKEALDHPKMLRTAKLYKKGGDYYLAVSIDLEDAKKIKPETYLGVSRGLKNKLYYCVTDLKGQILDHSSVLDPSFQKNKDAIPINELHIAANNIVSLALKFKSQVVMENLVNKGDKISWTDAAGNHDFPAYKCRDYNQVVKLLEYKLPEKGLPLPVKVSSVDIFYSCPSCGSHTRRSRFTKDLFLCTKCGTPMDIEKLGSLNLARKLIKYNSYKIKIKVVKLPGGNKFTNPLIGLDYYIPYNENQLERLEEEIQRLVIGLRNSMQDMNENERSKKESILKKFDNSKDLIEMFEFI
jgi:putative transposase